MPLRTLAVDCNSFFASCEQVERPELRGKPIAIVPVLAATTCCIAASYPAKAMGVKVGTGIAEARELCPDIILVQQRPALYIRYHRRILAALEQCIHVTHVKSIDEMECDLTATFSPRANALKVAEQIKLTINRDISPHLGVSIGIAPNWMLAKMATDMQKPNGLVVIEQDELPGRLLHLQLQDFLGIGPKMDGRLRAHGIETVAQLYQAPKCVLHGIWGSIEGDRMYDRMRGEPIPLLIDKHKTIGHSHVLPPQYRTLPGALAVLHRLTQKAAMRLRSIEHFASELAIHLDYFDGQAWSEDIRLTETQDTLTLTNALNRLWDARPTGIRRKAPFRVGVVLTGLRPPWCHTPDLFTAGRDVARRRLLGAVDKLNHTFGNGSVYFGGAHGATDSAPMRISFTCIPTPELEEIDDTRAGRVRPTPLAPPPPDESVQADSSEE